MKAKDPCQEICRKQRAVSKFCPFSTAQTWRYTVIIDSSTESLYIPILKCSGHKDRLFSGMRKCAFPSFPRQREYGDEKFPRQDNQKGLKTLRHCQVLTILVSRRESSSTILIARPRHTHPQRHRRSLLCLHPLPLSTPTFSSFRLLGSLSHLPSLPLQTPDALLVPLGAHLPRKVFLKKF